MDYNFHRENQERDRCDGLVANSGYRDGAYCMECQAAIGGDLPPGRGRPRSSEYSDSVGFFSKLEKIMYLSKEIDYGPLVLNLMFNFPGESPSTLDETFEYLRRLVDSGGNFTAGTNFYTYFPGDAVFSNIGRWESEHGTTIHYKEWWKLQETATAGYVLDASRNLPIRDSINRVHEGMKEFFEHAITNETILAKKMITAKKMVSEGRALKNWLGVLDKLLS